MPITRRHLLQAAGAIALSRKAWTASASPSWCDKPMRWAQVAFTEDDPGNYDRQMWLDYFRRIHADAACLSAGGVVAFYPTKIPFHYRSRFLGEGDAFGELARGCRGAGVARR